MAVLVCTGKASPVVAGSGWLRQSWCDVACSGRQGIGRVRIGSHGRACFVKGRF